jgi:hypothetical protein
MYLPSLSIVSLQAPSWNTASTSPNPPSAKTVVELVGVDVVGDLQVGQVAELVALGQVVDRDDVVDAAGVEALDDVAADEAGGAGDDDAGHANNSS